MSQYKLSEPLIVISNIVRQRTINPQRIFPEKGSENVPRSFVNKAERRVVGCHHILGHDRAPVWPAGGLRIGW